MCTADSGGTETKMSLNRRYQEGHKRSVYLLALAA